MTETRAVRLAASTRVGAGKAVSILRREIDLTLAQLGCPEITQLGPDFLHEHFSGDFHGQPQQLLLGFTAELKVQIMELRFSLRQGAPRDAELRQFGVNLLLHPQLGLLLVRAGLLWSNSGD